MNAPADTVTQRRQALRSVPNPAELLRKGNLGARKDLGQHFLTDTGVTDEIVYLHGPVEGKHIIEIGPGAGTLTRSLLYYDIASLTVVEKDPRFVALQERVYKPAAPDIITVLEADALHEEARYLPAPGEAFADGEKRHIIANLPYNIGTELVARWLTYGKALEAVTVMLQKETAMRFAAAAGDKAYGRLSVLAGLYADADIAMDIAPSRFTPPPLVDSAVLRLRLREEPRFGKNTAEKAAALAKALFAARRKTAGHSLKRIAGEHAAAILEAAGVDAKMRPDVIPPQAYAKMAQALTEAGVTLPGVAA